MGRKVVGNGSESGRQWVSKQKKGLLSAPKGSPHRKYLYIKKSEFIPGVYQLFFLNPGKEDAGGEILFFFVSLRVTSYASR